MIRAILFDLGRVIVPFDFARGYRRLEQHCGVPASEIPVRLAKTDLVPRFESGAVTADEFFAEFCQELNLNLAFADFRTIWSSIFLPHTLVPESLVAALAARYRLVLVSNTNSIHFEMVRANYPLLRHFHSYVLSHEVKAMKPSPAIYARAIAEAGCRPEECFFTDDIPEYVAGACAAGIDAVQFQDAAQLERELRIRGVEWNVEPE